MELSKTAEERQLAEIRRVREQIQATSSEKRKRDLNKYLLRLRCELAEYRRLRGKCNANS